MEYLLGWVLCGVLIGVVFGVLFGFGEAGFLPITAAFIFGICTLPKEDVVHKEHHQGVVLVSASTGVGVEGSFGIFSGYMDNKIYYRLRKEVGNSTYEDFLVSGALIKEDKERVDTGYYSAYYKCKVKTTTSFLWFKSEEFHKVDYTNGWLCERLSATIEVPSGSVIKEIKL